MKIVFLALAATVATSCFAQVNLQDKKKLSSAVSGSGKVPAKISYQKFDMKLLAGDRLDPKYVGTPISEVTKALEKITQGSRGEFESTPDFEARIAGALNSKFVGESSIEDTFAFVVDVKKGDKYKPGLRYSFDADSGEVSLMALPLVPAVFNGIGNPNPEAARNPVKDRERIDLDLSIESQSSYVGSNAYGASVQVERTIATQYGIASKRVSFLDFNRASPVPVKVMQIDNARAAKELPSLKGLILMKIDKPYLAYDFSHDSPTRENPRDISIRGKFLTGEVLGIVYFSGITGEIFARAPENLGK